MSIDLELEKAIQESTARVADGILSLFRMLASEVESLREKAEYQAEQIEELRSRLDKLEGTNPDEDGDRYA